MEKEKEEHIAKFWSKVRIGDPEECWEWQGSTSSTGGYGSFWHPGLKKVIRASRYSLILKLGRPLMDGEWALHKCDNPPCVNPSHLYGGTRSQNVQDALERGQWSSGNTKKTHCKRGHPFDEHNTRINPRGQRVCKKCDREIQAERRSTPEGREKARAADRRYRQRKRDMKNKGT